MAKFLITGASGQLGCCLKEKLEQEKIEFLAVSREDLDVTNRTAVFNTVSAFKPDVIINAAAYTAVDQAENDVILAENVNANGAKYLAEIAYKIDALMIHLSTDYVFDGEYTQPYKECDTAFPQSVYGRTKLLGELAVQDENPNSIILRTSWLFSEYGDNFVKTMLHLGKERDTLGIVGDQFGAPTYAGDIASALIQISEQVLAGKTNSYGVYHFSGYPYVSWYEFAKAIFAEAKLQKIIEKSPLVNAIATSDYPTPAKRPANSRLDLTKIKQTFGIEPSDWQKALKNISAYQG